MRAIILETFYKWSKTPYQKWFKKNEPWNLTIKELYLYPEHSLGNQLGRFLSSNDFTLEDKLENHDVFHVLTKTGITVAEEISMQFYLLGNGKKSLYLFIVILLGTLLYPDQWYRFLDAYKKGRRAFPFHQLDYKLLLHYPLITLQQTFGIVANNLQNKPYHHLINYLESEPSRRKKDYLSVMVLDSISKGKTSEISIN